jgi:membrane protein YdbS with pleckstrin-like domain
MRNQLPPEEKTRTATERRTGREARTALSALNARLALAVFGVVSCALLAWWSAELNMPALSGLLAVLALIAAVDLYVIHRRRRARDDGSHSLFE